MEPRDPLSIRRYEHPAASVLEIDGLSSLDGSRDEEAAIVDEGGTRSAASDESALRRLSRAASSASPVRKCLFFGCVFLALSAVGLSGVGLGSSLGLFGNGGAYDAATGAGVAGGAFDGASGGTSAARELQGEVVAARSVGAEGDDISIPQDSIADTADRVGDAPASPAASPVEAPAPTFLMNTPGPAEGEVADEAAGEATYAPTASDVVFVDSADDFGADFGPSGSIAFESMSLDLSDDGDYSMSLPLDEFPQFDAEMSLSASVDGEMSLLMAAGEFGLPAKEEVFADDGAEVADGEISTGTHASATSGATEAPREDAESQMILLSSQSTIAAFTAPTIVARPVPRRKCVASACSVELSPDLLMEYTVDVPDATAAEGCEGCAISVKLSYRGTAWIGFGFSTDIAMMGSEVVIGIPGSGQPPQKYAISGYSADAITPLQESRQTLADASIKTVGTADGVKTVMKFTKLLREEGEIEIFAGENYFVWAHGSDESFGYHAARGVVERSLLDEDGDSVSSEGESSTSTPESDMTLLSAQATTAVAAAPIIATKPIPNRECISSMCSVELSSDLLMEYLVDVPDNTTGEECKGCSISVKLSYSGAAWIGFGFSTDGAMMGSEAVIGIPIAGTRQTPQKYSLGGYSAEAVTPLPESQQTLTNASIKIGKTEDGIKTVMKFTKLLKEEGEIELLTGGNTFVWAHGSDENFGYHAARGSIELNLLGAGEDGLARALPAPAPATTASPTFLLETPQPTAASAAAESTDVLDVIFVDSIDNEDLGEMQLPTVTPQLIPFESMSLNLFDGDEDLSMPSGGVELQQFDAEMSLPAAAEFGLDVLEESMSMPSIIADEELDQGMSMPLTQSTTAAPSTAVNKCITSECSVELSPDLLLEYTVNVPDTTTAEECDGCTMSVKLSYQGIAWIGFGISTDGAMIGSEAVIGIPSEKIPRKYTLGAELAEAITPLPELQQTLTDASIRIVGSASGIKTVMKFTKLLKEEGEIELFTGGNTFIWAHGFDENFGYHASRGVIELNLLGMSMLSIIADEELDQGMSMPLTQSTTPAPSTAVNKCINSECSVELSPDLLLEYTVNVPDTTTAEECDGCTMSVKLSYQGIAWIGFGISTDGAMIGSEAVIGIPSEQIPRKYTLGAELAEAITPLPELQQTLTDASIIIVGNASGIKTVMKFTKLLKEEGEIELFTGGNTFIWAHGSDENFGYHASRGVIELNLLGEDEASVTREVLAPARASITRSVPASAPATTAAPTFLLETPQPTYQGNIATDSEESDIADSIVWATEATSTSTSPESTGFSDAIMFDSTDDSNDDDGEMTIPTVPADLVAFESMSLSFDDDGDLSMPFEDDNFVEWLDVDQSLPAPSTLVPSSTVLTTVAAETTESSAGESSTSKPESDMTLLAAQATTVVATTPIIATKPFTNRECISSMCAVELSSDLLMEYLVDVPDNTTGEECKGCSISVKLSYSGAAWIGFGFSTDGAMMGSEAVIGIPIAGTRQTPQKYSLGGYSAEAVTPLPESQQTLTNASIKIGKTEDGIKTVMKFTKILKEEGEIELFTRGNTFIWAHGSDENFGYHAARGLIELNLLGADEASTRSPSTAVVDEEMIELSATDGTIANGSFDVSVTTEAAGSTTFTTAVDEMVELSATDGTIANDAFDGVVATEAAGSTTFTTPISTASDLTATEPTTLDAIIDDTPTYSPTGAPELINVVLTPIVDTFIEVNSTLSFGERTRLKVDGSPQRITLLRFDLTHLSRTKAVELISSKLRLYALTSSSYGGRIDIVDQDICGEWTEALTWTNAPPGVFAEQPESLGEFGEIKQDEWNEAELTLNLQYLPLQFTIKITSDQANGVTYASMENSTAVPRLVMKYLGTPYEATAAPTAYPTEVALTQSAVAITNTQTAVTRRPTKSPVTTPPTRIPTISPVESVVIEARRDSMLRNGKFSGDIFGFDPYIAMKSSTNPDWEGKSILQFDLSDLSGSVDYNFELKLFITYLEFDWKRTLTVSQITNDFRWGEEWITWDRLGNPNMEELGSGDVVSGDVGSYITIPLGSIKPVNGRVNLVVEISSGPSEGSKVDYKSRENGSDPPLLIASA